MDKKKLNPPKFSLGSFKTAIQNDLKSSYIGKNPSIAGNILTGQKWNANTKWGQPAEVKKQPIQASGVKMPKSISPAPKKVVGSPKIATKITPAPVNTKTQVLGMRVTKSPSSQNPRAATPTPSPYPTITPPPDQAADPYAGLINETSSRNNIPDHILYNMIKKESNFNPNAGSNKGAQGIAQIVPKWHPTVKDPYNPQEAIPYAGKHLRESYDAFGSWENALAAYNAGGPAVGKYGGVPPYTETEDYVTKIMDWAEQDKQRYKKKKK